MDCNRRVCVDAIGIKWIFTGKDSKPLFRLGLV